MTWSKWCIPSHRIARYLEKVGLVERDMENSFLNLPDDEDSLLQLQGASVSFRIAMGPQQGQKVFTLQTLPTSNEGEKCEDHNVSIIACIIDVHFIQKILKHL